MFWLSYLVDCYDDLVLAEAVQLDRDAALFLVHAQNVFAYGEASRYIDLYSGAP